MTVFAFLARVGWLVASVLVLPLMTLGLCAVGIGAGQHFIQNYGHSYSKRVPKPSGLDGLTQTRRPRVRDLSSARAGVESAISGLFGTSRGLGDAAEARDAAPVAAPVETGAKRGLPTDHSAPLPAPPKPLPSGLARVLLRQRGSNISRRHSFTIPGSGNPHAAASDITTSVLQQNAPRDAQTITVDATGGAAAALVLAMSDDLPALRPSIPGMPVDSMDGNNTLDNPSEAGVGGLRAIAATAAVAAVSLAAALEWSDTSFPFSSFETSVQQTPLVAVEPFSSVPALESIPVGSTALSQASFTSSTESWLAAALDAGCTIFSSLFTPLLELYDTMITFLGIWGCNADVPWEAWALAALATGAALTCASWGCARGHTSNHGEREPPSAAVSVTLAATRALPGDAPVTVSPSPLPSRGLPPPSAAGASPQLQDALVDDINDTLTAVLAATVGVKGAAAGVSAGLPGDTTRRSSRGNPLLPDKFDKGGVSLNILVSPTDAVPTSGELLGIAGSARVSEASLIRSNPTSAAPAAVALPPPTPRALLRIAPMQAASQQQPRPPPTISVASPRFDAPRTGTGVYQSVDAVPSTMQHAAAAAAAAVDRRAAARQEARRRLLEDVAAAAGVPLDDPALLWAVHPIAPA